MKAELDVFRDYLHYNPETGEFTWLKSPMRRVKVGSRAGCLSIPSGRVQIKFKGKQYLAHQLAWLFTHGIWPVNVIDHIDGNPFNNAISNLRDVTQQINMHNQKRIAKHNKSGYRGVCWDSVNKSWRATITLDGKSKTIGRFPTALQASQAYETAKRIYHPTAPIR